MRAFRFFVPPTIVSLVFACSSGSSGSSSPPPCNEDPWECPSGQTCWPNSATTFACLNSGSGTAGGACVASQGMPTCGDGLVCAQMPPAGGTCVAYCDETDPSHACPAGESCSMFVLAGAVIQLCTAPSSSADGG